VVAMASTPALVISDLLCFALNAFKKVAARRLKSLLMHYYTPDVISLSKSQILEDVDALEGLESLKVTRKWRDSVSRSNLELDDIMSIITFADENNLHLPRYLSSSPGNMPSIRLVEGDLHLIWNKLTKLEESFKLSERSSIEFLEIGNKNSLCLKEVAIDTKASAITCREILGHVQTSRSIGLNRHPKVVPSFNYIPSAGKQAAGTVSSQSPGVSHSSRPPFSRTDNPAYGSVGLPLTASTSGSIPST